jgi:tetratricopeptide (TPR) repeat protein
VNSYLTRYRSLLICLVLAAGTLALYEPVIHYEFVDVDDPRFVINNDHVRAGFSWAGLVWATHTVYVETWQPVTWVSHMLDCQLYGLNAGGHHLTSLLIHVANTCLLFVWLNGLTKATWRSAFVAALFAWHPLHVESVAWICERKDVLSTLFWMLALLAYTRYARKPGPGRYALVAVLYALGMMSKPMAVTLPCVLLLVDFWPLNRFGFQLGAAGPIAGRLPAGWPAGAIARSCQSLRLPTWVGNSAVLILEKVPLFLLALGMTAATVYAEGHGGTLAGLGGLPMHTRVANALISYRCYLTETFWPTHLAFFYPYSFDLPLAAVLGAVGLLLLWSGCFLLRARLQPYLLMGWCWWLGTLVPAIGLIQFCSQARADRYMYIPAIGLFMALVWGVTDLLGRRSLGRKLLPLIGCLALVGCLGASAVQVRYWQNSVTMARHAIEVTRNNYAAYESLGTALYQRGLKSEAILCYRQALAISDQLPESHYNLGIALMDAGQIGEAIDHFAAAVQILPDHYELHQRLGAALLAEGQGRLAEATREFSEAVRLNPDFAEGQADWGIALVKQGDPAQALPHFLEAVRLGPTNTDFRFDLGLDLLDAHRYAEAAAQFSEELKIAPNETRAHYRLARAQEQLEDFAGAVSNYRFVLHQAPDFAEAKSALEQILSAHPELK